MMDLGLEPEGITDEAHQTCSYDDGILSHEIVKQKLHALSVSGSSKQ
jgi:hypothetical protein